ncbi:MAG: hypothetical protein OXF44_01120 [Anaerolineaceae bacterium]|nr:hypothetical protein [Anaerolineaceae bacterium]
MQLALRSLRARRAFRWRRRSCCGVRGLLAEPTSAVPVAALLSGQLPLEGRIVIPLTGSGLKSLA